MRIVVTSDSHKMASRLLDVVERHMNDTELFIFLGDGEDDIENVMALYPKLNIEIVAGNCDWHSTAPLYKSIFVNGKKIFFTHGHPFYVKMGYDDIIQKAKEEKADICLFGHTHNPYTNYIDSIHFMNPGAVFMGSYGIIDITDKGIIAYNAKI